MKVLFLISTMFLSGVFAPVHDVPLAVFHIMESNGMLEIDITFDLEDFSKSLDVEIAEVNVERMQKYLTENTSFQFNAKVANLKISEVKIVRDHIEVKGNFVEIIKNINNIKIENTCLNNIRRHSNVMQIELNDETKDFRMHSRRTIINLTY